MSVYVDALFKTAPRPGWRFRSACHMVADTAEELHAMADRIGHKRSWFQEKPGGIPHYDLTATRRQLAIRYGAIEIDRKELSRLITQYRASQAVLDRHDTGA